MSHPNARQMRTGVKMTTKDSRRRTARLRRMSLKSEKGTYTPARHYAKDFYESYRRGSLGSAKEIVPLVLELVDVRSVIDIGCGDGAWLSVFRDHGVEDVWGVDGEWVDPRRMLIPEERFPRHDLSRSFRMNRQFDLVLSLEVAEHLPSGCADTLVDSITRLGAVVVFSAAIPFQGGTHHVNEQWPDYWVQHFEKRGYAVVDCIRKRIWKNENVNWWYAQNTLMFLRRDRLNEYPHLRRELVTTETSLLSMVHPTGWLRAADPRNRSPRDVLEVLPLLVRRALRSWKPRQKAP